MCISGPFDHNRDDDIDLSAPTVLVSNYNGMLLYHHDIHYYDDDSDLYDSDEDDDNVWVTFFVVGAVVKDLSLIGEKSTDAIDGWLVGWLLGWLDVWIDMWIDR